MSTATDLLLIAKDNGLLFSLEGENLRVRWQGVPPSQDLLASIKTHKPELISLLARNDNLIPNAPTSNRYQHLITCQQCQHLTLTGHCKVKLQYKPLPEAMRDCMSFETVQGERTAIENTPYTQSELNDLLSRYEKKLFYHLVDCVACSFMDSRYCVEGFAIGSSYDAMLLVFDDAASKRDALITQVIKARISGRSVFRSATN
jgi:hypothetical protein